MNSAKLRDKSCSVTTHAMMDDEVMLFSLVMNTEAN